MFDLSPIQVLIVLAIALVVFGPKRLPEMARGIGKGLREFKEGITTDEPSAPRTRTGDDVPPAALESSAEPVDEDLDGLIVPGDQHPGSSRD